MLLGTNDRRVPDEVILDRNRYPEQIEVFRMPSEIPDYERKDSKDDGAMHTQP
jgi:hypothetical protein